MATATLRVAHTAASVSEDDRSLLVTIIETNPAAWAAQLGAEPTVVDKVMNQLLLFMNAFLALREDNLIAVYAAHFGLSKLLYANGPEGTTENDKAVTDTAASELRGKYELFATMNRMVSRDIKDLVESMGRPAPGDTSSSLASCLTMALCYINRVLKNDELADVKPRILVISVSPDTPAHFIPVMNCLFSSQKMSIPIDVCALTTSESVFLQQASHITGGLFIRTESITSILPTLLSVFLPDRHARKLLVMPQKHDVDFRASCFCHKRLVDIGYVCSVCLSIFCSSGHASCSTCGTIFNNPTRRA